MQAIVPAILSQTGLSALPSLIPDAGERNSLFSLQAVPSNSCHVEQSETSLALACPRLAQKSEILRFAQNNSDLKAITQLPEQQYHRAERRVFRVVLAQKRAVCGLTKYRAPASSR